MTPAKFRSIRDTLGLSQAALAKVMGYSGGQPWISAIENGGAVSPQAERLMLLYLGGARPDDWPSRRMDRK